MYKRIHDGIGYLIGTATILVLLVFLCANTYFFTRNGCKALLGAGEQEIARYAIPLTLILVLGLLICDRKFKIFNIISVFSNKYLENGISTGTFQVLFGIGFLLRGGYVIFAHYHVPIISDSEICLQAARQLAEGNPAWCQQESYFVRWGYQLPFVLYEAAVLKIFGTWALYVLNAVYGIVSCWLLYKILKQISANDSMVQWIIVLYLFMPSAIFHVGILYNQVISGMVMLCGIYFFVRGGAFSEISCKKTVFAGGYWELRWPSVNYFEQMQ